jgi:hypothetical protein
MPGVANGFFFRSCLLVIMESASSTPAWGEARPMHIPAFEIFSCLGTIMVRGPGQKVFASDSKIPTMPGLMALPLMIPAADRLETDMSDEATCTIRGSNEGRSFVLNILVTADASKAFPASPYTVSVGSPTTSPRQMASTAELKSSAVRISALLEVIAAEAPVRP